MAESTFVEIAQLIGDSTNSASTATEWQKNSVSYTYIHKVPADIRKWKEEAYTPSIVAIGPYHRNIRPPEDLSDLNRLISECSGRKLDVKQYINNPYLDMEASDDSKYQTDKLLVRDAYLIIEIFLRRMDDAMIDLLLLENQLPFCLIEELFHRDYANTSPSLIKLTFDYFQHYNVLNINPSNVKIQDFTDLLRTFYLPPSRQLPKRGRKRINLLYTATQLQEAGVNIEVSSSKCILDFKFDFQTGRLQIPRLELEDVTEILVRNVLALEQTRYVGNGYVTDYFHMMSSLVQSKEDLDLLCKLHIVNTGFCWEDARAQSFFQDICKGMKLEDMNHDYIVIFKKLKKFHNRPRNLIRMWMKPLKRDYFGNPWVTASTIAAIILLVLTFIQTVCSVIQNNNKDQAKAKVPEAHTAVSLANLE